LILFQLPEMCGILLVVTGVRVVEVDARAPHPAPEASATTSNQGVNARDGGARDKSSAPSLDADTAFLLGLSRRGPDGVGAWARSIGGGSGGGGGGLLFGSDGGLLLGSNGADIRLGGSLLQLRGAAPSAAPLVDAEGNVLCFNGEVFGGLPGLGRRDNDASALLQALATAGSPSVSDGGDDNGDGGGDGGGGGITRVLSRLRGPWALVYWHESTQRLWYGRDVVGRRSLLVHRPDARDARFLLSSVAPLPAADYQGGFSLDDGRQLSTTQPISDSVDSSGGAAQSLPGFWDEVEAGVYSLGAEATRADNNVADVDVVAGPCQVDGVSNGGGEAPSGGECAARWLSRRHAWCDGVPCVLHEFQRAAPHVHPDPPSPPPPLPPIGCVTPSCQLPINERLWLDPLCNENPPLSSVTSTPLPPTAHAAQVPTRGKRTTTEPELGVDPDAVTTAVDGLLAALDAAVECRVTQTHSCATRTPSQQTCDSSGDINSKHSSGLPENQGAVVASHWPAAASSAPHSQSATAVKAAAPSHWPTAELGVLFSGGVDSMVVAAIAHRCPLPAPHILNPKP